MEITTGDYITIGALFVSIIIGLSTLVQARNSRFMSGINIERVRWANNLKELFSQYGKSILSLQGLMEDVKIQDLSNEGEGETKKEKKILKAEMLLFT
ncbi:hypothetical protein AB3N04_00190 (plasmid) [Alkalihalophilus sp. As8PL]|uniref:Uncharacterized protein n=1 Tax=Alkalihalophilus sp. As8PL TaxID=3237103 RepID=A0AB39BNR8_9BACI